MAFNKEKKIHINYFNTNDILNKKYWGKCT